MNFWLPYGATLLLNSSFCLDWYLNRMVVLIHDVDRYLSYIMDVATPTADCLTLVYDLLKPVIMKGHNKSMLSHQEVHIKKFSFMYVPVIILVALWYSSPCFAVMFPWFLLLSALPEPNPGRNQGSDWTGSFCWFWELQVSWWIITVWYYGCVQACNWACSTCLGACCQALYSSSRHTVSGGTNKFNSLFPGTDNWEFSCNDLFVGFLFLYNWRVVSSGCSQEKIKKALDRDRWIC